MDAPYAMLEPLEAGIGRLLAHNPSAFTYTGTQTYLVGEAEVAVIDPGPAIPEHLDAIESRDRRPIGRGDHVHPHPPRPQPGRAPARRPRPARRSSAARRCSSRRPARSMPAFDADYVPDRVLVDGEALEVDGRKLVAVATPGPHLQPSLLRLERRAVHRRSCDGLVDHRGRPARRRHGRLYGEPGKAAAARRPHPLSRARAAGDQAQPICARHLIGHRMQREKQILRHRRGGTADHSRKSSARPIPGSTRGWCWPPGGSVLAHLVDLERRGLVEGQGEQWTSR